MASQRLKTETRFVLHKLRFVVVHREVVCQLNEVHEFFAIEHGEPLPRIEQEGNAGFMALSCVLNHAFSPIRCNDGQSNVLRIVDAIAMCFAHGARMESRNLVVIEVGRDESLGGIAAIYGFDVAGIKAARLQALSIRPKVIA